MMVILAFTISFIMMKIAVLTSEKSSKEREKMTPFECGFSPFKKARSPFSLRFFTTTLIFLIFDIEIAILLPLGLLSKSSDFLMLKNLGLIITIILLIGLIHEWNQGALKWVS